MVQEHAFTFRFTDPEQLPPPVLSFDNVAFAYNGKLQDALYRNLELAIDTDSRVALVGPNGVGKSTLLNLMIGKLDATEGRVGRHMSLKLSMYNQHTAELLPMDKCALEFMHERYAALKQDREWWRGQLGKFGISGSMQTVLLLTLI